MAGESLKDIGINLSNDFQALVWNYTSGWLAADLFSSEDWQEIALLVQETAQFDRVIHEVEVLESLLTTGFIPPDLAGNPINLAEEAISDDRANIHPYLETWKRYESLMNPVASISTVHGKSNKTEWDRPIFEQNLTPQPLKEQGKREKERNFSPSLKEGEGSREERFFQSSEKTEAIAKNPLEIGKRSENNVEKISLTDTAIAPNDAGWFNSDSDRVSEVLPVDEFVRETQTQYSKVLPVDEFVKETQTQYSKNVNLSSLDEAREKTSQIQKNLAPSLPGIKGLKDLSAFLASQPNRELTIEADLLSNNQSSELVDSQIAKSRNIVTYVSEEVEEKTGLLEVKERESEKNSEIVYDSRNQQAIEEHFLSSDRTPEVDMEIILEAIAQEINREYRRFYGE